MERDKSWHWDLLLFLHGSGFEAASCLNWRYGYTSQNRMSHFDDHGLSRVLGPGGQLKRATGVVMTLQIENNLKSPL